MGGLSACSRYFSTGIFSDIFCHSLFGIKKIPAQIRAVIGGINAVSLADAMLCCLFNF